MSCSKKLKNGELLELIAWGRAELLRAGIEEAQEECERALMKLLGCSRSGIYLEEHELIASGVRERFLTLLEKRLKRIPLAYLMNEADFWQETLYVDERCLIPRPETEILVEQVLKSFGDEVEKSFSFLDIGTGSGAIAVAILRTLKMAHGTLLDISGEALEVAQKNLKCYALEDRAKLVRGDLFEPFSIDEKWDLIVSNPPYLSEEDWTEVQEELRFEPRRALDGGKDGLDYYRKIILEAKDHLNHGGRLALEVGQGQADKVSKWLQEAGYDNIQRFNDHLQVQRVVTAQRHS
ncbi:MAG: peptide chain release factor N(5)-glutamine methyltransferase [Candidatus Omnitrophota bacterium]